LDEARRFPAKLGNEQIDKGFRDMKLKAFFLVMAIFLAALAPLPAAATPYTWNGGTGFWDTGTNWTPTGVPNFIYDTATVGGGVATLDYFQRTVNKLEVGAGAEVQISYSTDSSLSFANYSGVDPTLINNGIVRLAHTGNYMSKISAGSPLTITGNGKILMEWYSPTNDKGSILTGPIINSLGHTIEGMGKFTNAVVDNYGLVQATGDRLTVQASTFRNYTNGILRSNPGAVLHFGYLTSTIASAQYQGYGGWLDINGGTISTDNATFTDAQIRNSGSGGSIEINASRTLRFFGTNNLQSGVVVNVNGNLEVGYDDGSYTAGHITGNSQVNVQDGGKLSLKLISASAGATLTARDLTMSPAAAIEMKYKTNLTLSNFSYAMTNGSGWTWNNYGTLTMTGDGPGHLLEVGGIPGASNPLVGNFFIPNLVISGDITLVDLFDNQTGYEGLEALYVGSLTFDGSSLNLNGLSLYVQDGSGFNLVLAGDYDGKVINSPVPLPPSALLLGSGLLGLLAFRSRRRRD
jgi:hypothetical protein